MTPTNIFKDGLYLVGVEYGALVARTVFKNCPEVAKYVKKIITYGGYNLGV